MAIRIAIANRRRLVVTLVGAALAVALIIYQTFLIVGFIASATAMAKGIDADVWVVAHQAQAFDFSAPTRRDHAFTIRGIAGVASAEPVLTGFVNGTRSDGTPVVLAIAGIPIERFRIDAGKQDRMSALPESDRFAFVDRTALKDFSVDATPFELEIGGERVALTHTMDGYATFLGSPFLATSFTNAQRWLRIPDGSTGIAVWVSPDSDAETVIGAIRTVYPELSVFSADEYARRSAIFWLTRTGAGGGLLLSAVLGLGIGLLIISQNLYASVLESMQQYITLRAMGFHARTLALIVMAQSVAIALAAGLIGTVLAYIFSSLTKAFVLGWIAQPIAVPLLTMVLCAFMGLFSSTSAIRLIHRLEPANALRQ